MTRDLAVDLVAPAAPGYTAPRHPEGRRGHYGHRSRGRDRHRRVQRRGGCLRAWRSTPPTGSITGTPDTAGAAATATVTVSDTADNEATVDIAFPAVDKGDQTLAGFGYSAGSVTLGTAAPTLIAPSGAETAPSYSTNDSAVCTVDATSGALRLVGPGSCEVTATAGGHGELQ